MASPRYDKEKYYRIMDMTQSNYSYQLKRILKNKKRSSFILIYYSVALIVYSLSAVIFPDSFDLSWTSYSSIILSIIVLIYSLINGKAGYDDKIRRTQNALNQIKRLKREVGSLPEQLIKNTESTSAHQEQVPLQEQHLHGAAFCTHKTCNMFSYCSRQNFCAKLEEIKREYDQIISSTDVRDDLDFYYTIVALCKKYRIGIYTGTVKEIKGSTNDPNRDTIIEEIQGYISENSPLQQRFYLLFLTVVHAIIYAAPIIIFFIGLYKTRCLIFSMVQFLCSKVRGCPLFLAG